MTKIDDINDSSSIVKLIRAGDRVGLAVFVRQGGDPNMRDHVGWTLLHIAALEGKAEIAELLLEAGATVNCCTTDMCTPLHVACTQGHKSTVEVLVKKDAYVNAQDKNGSTALHEASRGVHTSIVKFLLEHKADRQKANKKKQIFTDVIGQQMMAAVESGDYDVILQWLDWGLTANTFGNLHWSLLHHAAARGQWEIANLLIVRGADVDCKDSNRSSPLHAASFHGHIKVAQLLVKSGADVNTKDQCGNTPLQSAIAGAHPDILNLLLDNGCDTSIPNNEGQIFTHLVNEFLVEAVDNCRISHVASLLKGRADPNSRDKAGVPVICCASFKSQILIVDALLSAGSDANLRTEDNQKSALHYAACIGNLFILKALLDKGACVKATDTYGLTPLHEAAREGSDDVVLVLVGRSSPMDAQSTEGNTPLHEAARWGQSAVVDYLLEKGADGTIANNSGLLYSDLALMRAVRTEDAAQVVSGLAWGGNLNVVDAKGWTLMHHAVYKSAFEVCSVLLESEAAVNVRDKHGRTPLLLAAYRGEYKIMEMLLNYAADPDESDLNGETPLHWAAKEGSVDAVQLLLNAGADAKRKNKEGLRYSDYLSKHLYFAVRHNDERSVEALLQAGADQTAVLKGTGVTAREEAKRRKNFPILRQLVAFAPTTNGSQEQEDDGVVIEDVRNLFQKENVDENAPSNVDHDQVSSEEEEETNQGMSTLENWKIRNASEMVNAKDLFQDEEKAFWEYWEEKPKVISSKDLFRQENWWENESNTGSSSDATSSSDESEVEQEKISAWQEAFRKKEIISAKELFREDECWWRDAVEELNDKEHLQKDAKPWWERSSSPTEADQDKATAINSLNNGPIIEINNEVISNNGAILNDSVRHTKDENDTQNSIYGNENFLKPGKHFSEEDSVTEDWETANELITISDDTSMYTVSEFSGKNNTEERVLAEDVFKEKPWWNIDNLKNSVEEEGSECESFESEITDINDELSSLDKNRNDKLERKQNNTLPILLENISKDKKNLEKEDLLPVIINGVLENEEPQQLYDNSELLNLNKELPLNDNDARKIETIFNDRNKNIDLEEESKSSISRYENDGQKYCDTDNGLNNLATSDTEKTRNLSCENLFSSSIAQKEDKWLSRSLDFLLDSVNSETNKRVLSDNCIIEDQNVENFIQTPSLKINVKNIPHLYNKNKSRSKDEKLVKLPPSVITNKMDTCLAKLDARLAWLDANMATETNLTQCDQQQPPVCYESKPRVENTELNSKAKEIENKGANTDDKETKLQNSRTLHSDTEEDCRNIQKFDVFE